MKQKRLQYKIAVWLTMGLMIVDPLVVPFAYAANPIEVDTNAPHERQATVGQAGNGITLVNVAGPSAGGVSRNDYTNFNVPQNGVILNNSNQMANTKLGGYVPGNPNMMRGSANVIVNEVTSHNPTEMKGFIEVAGRKASVVVANPNGITVDGGGFINTDRAVLTTGKTEYDSKGNLNSYRVEQGRISINSNGLNAKDANSLQILTEATNVNAGVWANTIETRTGKNTIDANTLDTQKIGDSSNIGLDVSAIGGMYANSITMKGTNTGLGVNVKGVVSSTQASSITSDGKIIVDGGVTSNGNTTLSGQSIAIHNNGVVQGDVSTTVNSKEAVNNSGLINSGKTTDIKAKSVDNNEGGRIYGDTVAIDANTVKNHTNSEIEQRYHKAGKALEKAKNDLDAEWNADITKYKTKTELEAHRQRIKELTNAYDEAQENVTTIKKELDTHKSGVIAGRNHVDITSDTINNTGKGFIYSGGTMDLTAKEGINNTGSTIKAVKSIELDTPVVNNKNVALGVKRVSDGITKNPDKLKVTHPHHKLEGQVFDKSEFPYADYKSGYGTPHVKPVKTAEDEAYNKEMDKRENRVNEFTIIRTETEHTHKEVTNDDPGVISSGGDVVTTGILHNDNSKVISGGTVHAKGSIQNISDSISDKTFITGTTQESYTTKVDKSHHIGRKKKRRKWRPEVYMTPTIAESNVKPIGTVQEHAEDTLSKATIARVNDSLDPYGLGGGKGKESHTIDGLSLPTEALYQIHPDITANALIETDSAFTNRKNFLSSQYMIDALANDPERRLKRLGDGFYEQQLINDQIVSATGKQYLEGYTDNEAEYKALLEAGIAFGKAFKLAPGIALSKEQMEAITSDMVWLETKTVVVDGKAQQVLYPKVYLAKQPAKSVDAMGGIISGKSIVSNTNTDILNQGIMTADTIVLGAHDVQNTGRIDGRQVNIKASQDVINTGNIHGDKQVTINAGRDINVGAHVDRLEHHDIVSRQGTIGVAKDGDLVLSAKRDVNLKGAIVHTGDNSKATIEAGQNINLTTEALSSKKDMTVNSDNYNRTDRRTELGTAILSDSHVNLRAGNDVNIRNGIVNSEHGVTSVEAGNDVNITKGNSYSRDEYGLKYKEKSLLSRTTNIIRTDHEHTGVLSSTIGGDTINVKANRNVSVTGSNILGTKDVSVSAGNDVRTDSGEETQRDDVYQYSKKSGLMGAGIGFTIGSKKVTDTLDENSKTNVNTLIGSANGKISIDANNKAHLTSTDLIGKDDIEVSASDITLDGKHDTIASKQVHEEKQSGLTVSLDGSIASALTTARGFQRKANSRDDKRLGTLESLEAGKELKKGYSKIQEYKNFTPDFVRDEAQKLIASGILKEQKVKEIDSLLQNNKLTDNTRKALEKERKRLAEEASYEKAKGYNDLNDINGDQKQYKENKQAKKDGLANIHVSVGSSKSRSESRLDSSKYVGGHIVSENGIKLVTKPSTTESGDIVAIGETIRGKSVELDASRNLSLQAGTNTTTITDKYDSKGWSIGANLSVNGGGLLGIDASYNKANENGTTVKTTHSGTVVQGNKVITNSGADTTIVGSKIYGDSIKSQIGGNLTIKSLQDSETYRGEKKNVGFSISTNGTQLGGVSAEYSKGKMTSDYASVTEQAGLYAGDVGFDITNKGNTTLEGAVIDSKAKADKNKLSTKSLTVKDIKNKAEYKSSNTGLSYTSVSGFKNLSQAGKDAVYNSLGLLPKLLPDSEKSIESTTKSVIANGTIKTESSNIDINKISKDTKNSLNKLDTIFDKKKVEERQELARLFAKDAFEQLHYWEPKTKEGKAAKALAHAVVAETSARIAGNPKGSGFYAGATNEALIGEIQKIAKSNPAVAQWLSASLGALVNYGLGKSPITGAAEAQYGTKWNFAGAVVRLGVSTSKIAVDTTSGEIISEFSPFVGNPSAFDQVTTKPVSFSDRVSDQSTPMDDVISPGPDLTESSNLSSPVVLKSEDYKLYNLPPDIDNQTGQISIWDNEKQAYVKTNTYEFGGIKVNDLGGYDEFNRAIFTEVGTGNLVYGINKYGVTLYRGSDGQPNWHLVIPENNFAKIGKLDGTSFERLNITTGDLDMLRDPSSTAIYDSINSRIINSNTGNPLSAIGYKNFKNSISLDTISKEELDMIRYNKDNTVSINRAENKSKDKFYFRDSYAYKHSNMVIDGYQNGTIEKGKFEFTEKPEFSLGLENVNFDNGVDGAINSWNGITIKGGIKANLAKINMRRWTGYEFWGDTQANIFEGNLGGDFEVNSSGLTVGANAGFNIANIKPKIKFDMGGSTFNLDTDFLYGFNAGAKGHVGYNEKGFNASGAISKPSIGGGINLKGSIETDNSEVTLYEYNSNKKNKSDKTK
ncbi:MAG: hemagglutinin repeat-containing protein [Veillonella dispar]|uniref:two-partner secretion domain-containing protein n=1 Tax=Veillonella dispar TaxID=39778 RepID=UPI00280BE08D|nr:hemagglutinin repeat-containing protein [Veillonella dispar]MDU4885417.1 hemagglutinin repeat-containing protein [Veillonella dispar]